MAPSRVDLFPSPQIPSVPNSKSSSTQQSSLLHRSLTEHPHSVSTASGIALNLPSGQTIIDACGGAAVVCLGHGNEEVAAAAAERMKMVSYVHTQTYTTDSAEDLGRFILEGNPFGLEKAVWVGSGELETYVCYSL